LSAARFFVEGVHELGDVVALDGGDAHKVLDVLRMREGDELEIVDSASRRFKAVISIDRRSVRAELHECVNTHHAPVPQVTVAQAIPKGQKMDFVVEKLTELGVAQILPLHSERTVVTEVGDQKLERWRRLAKTAAQQCGRTDIPQIPKPVSLKDLTTAFASYDAVLFPWELADASPLHDVLPALVRGARRVLAIVGPEGGFSHEEAAASKAAGAHLLHLGPRILRTETAGLVLLAILNYLWV
jgi:16S rRNA (uracil1498-N3)-methyltransferase